MLAPENVLVPAFHWYWLPPVAVSVACCPKQMVVSNPAYTEPLSVDRKSTRLNSSYANISYAVFCLKKKIEQKFPQAPIPNFVAMEILVFAFLIVVFLLVRSRLSVESPGCLQHVFDSIPGLVARQSR